MPNPSWDASSAWHNIRKLEKENHWLQLCEEIWQIFFNFGRIMAIKNFKNHMILVLLIFEREIYIYIYISGYT
jgi:hypothetical protein